jgi:DNA (cytosine-5)-methyltransferase 3A
VSVARLALQNVGIKVDRYVAYEIDKNAIKISQKHFNDIERRGNVVDADFSEFKNYDLLIGGSPCQDLSSQNKKRLGLKGEKSKLFFEFVRALEEIKPKYFLLENVASMSKENREQISKILGVQPIHIDSKLLTAQGRRRLYWTNIPNVTLPEDKGIKTKDIISPDDNYIKNYSWSPLENSRFAGIIDGRSYISASRIININYHANCLDTSGNKYYLYNNKLYRFSPLECERLQGLPDNYTEGISMTARYKALGNSFTLPVIEHILNGITK